MWTGRVGVSMVYKSDRNYAIYAGVMEVDRLKMVPRMERLGGKRMNGQDSFKQCMRMYPLNLPRVPCTPSREGSR